MPANVNIRRLAKGLGIDIDDKALAAADPKILQGCIEAVLKCNEKSGCLTNGITLTSDCFKTNATHNAASKCIDKCFGCA